MTPNGFADTLADNRARPTPENHEKSLSTGTTLGDRSGHLPLMELRCDYGEDELLGPLSAAEARRLIGIISSVPCFS